MSARRTTGNETEAKASGKRRRGARAPAAAERGGGGGGATDWERLRRMTDREAARGAAADPDNPPADPTWLAAGHLVQPRPKRAISLRLDPDVLEWFRSTGPRYQTRINAVLRAYVEHQRRRRA